MPNTSHLGVLATDELHARGGAINPAAIELAKAALVKAMAGGRARILDVLTEHALSICSAQSAGVSIFNSKECDELTWEKVQGELSNCTGRRFPLRHSMCGICLERREPQLFRQPHALFEWMGLNGIWADEALVVPLCGVGNDVYGTVWVFSHDDTAKFNEGHAQMLMQLGIQATACIRLLRERVS